MKESRAKNLLICTRLALGAVFIAASILKIAHPAEFAKILYNYQVIPNNLINMTAIVLPWLEAIMGMMLLAGIWLPGAAVLANLLLLAFFSALLFNVARGLNIHCGCFSINVAGEPQTAWYMVRDSLFLALGFALLFQVFRKRPTAR